MMVIRGWLLAFLLAIPLVGEGATLHTIIIADTLDFSLGPFCQVSFNALQVEAKRIAYYTDLQPRFYCYDGDKMALSPCLDKIKHLDVAPDDVILLFYLGHGYRQSHRNHDTPWPYLYFFCDRKSYSFDALTTLLKSKQPHLLVAVADTCNAIVSPTPELPVAAARMRAPSSNDRSLQINYKTLFLETSGTIIASSAKPNEYAWYNQNGGCFTQQLLKELQLEMHLIPGNADWHRLFESTCHALEQLQHPQYHLETHKL